MAHTLKVNNGITMGDDLSDINFDNLPSPFLGSCTDPFDDVPIEDIMHIMNTISEPVAAPVETPIESVVAPVETPVDTVTEAVVAPVPITKVVVKLKPRAAPIEKNIEETPCKEEEPCICGKKVCGCDEYSDVEEDDYPGEDEPYVPDSDEEEEDDEYDEEEEEMEVDVETKQTVSVAPKAPSVSKTIRLTVEKSKENPFAPRVSRSVSPVSQSNVGGVCSDTGGNKGCLKHPDCIRPVSQKTGVHKGWCKTPGGIPYPKNNTNKKRKRSTPQTMNDDYYMGASYVLETRLHPGASYTEMKSLMEARIGESVDLGEFLFKLKKRPYILRSFHKKSDNDLKELLFRKQEKVEPEAKRRTMGV